MRRATWTSPLARAASVDLRSLALLRVGCAAVILCDLAGRAVNLAAHYTDAGILPRSAVLDWLPREASLSIYMLNGATWYQALLFIITAAVAAAFGLGYRTRIASILTWYLVFALQVRNPAIDFGGDNLLRVTLFWAMFLPLGARWSLDRAAGRQPAPASDSLLSIAGVAAKLQLCLVYWTTAALKWNPAWLSQGTALNTAIRLDYISTPTARLLLLFPRLLRFLTRATFGLEILGPLAAWSPWFTGPLQSLVVLAFVLLHLVGMATALRLGIFPWVAAVAWTLFLPTWFWDRLPETRLKPLLDRLDRLDRRDHSSRSAGELAPRPPRRFTSLAAVAGVALLLIYTVLLNLREVWPSPFASLLPPVTDHLSDTLALHQRWNMFAPSPPTDDGWLLVPARTQSGQLLDAWTQAPLDPIRPAAFASVYQGSRWTTYLSGLRRPKNVFHRRFFANYLCRRWNTTHPDPITNLTLIYMLELTVPPNQELAPRPLVLFAERCPPK